MFQTSLALRIRKGRTGCPALRGSLRPAHEGVRRTRNGLDRRQVLTAVLRPFASPSSSRPEMTSLVSRRLFLSARERQQPFSRRLRAMPLLSRLGGPVVPALPEAVDALPLRAAALRTRAALVPGRGARQRSMHMHGSGARGRSTSRSPPRSSPSCSLWRSLFTQRLNLENASYGKEATPWNFRHSLRRSASAT